MECTPITQQPVETRISVTTALSTVSNKKTDASENNHSTPLYRNSDFYDTRYRAEHFPVSHSRTSCHYFITDRATINFSKNWFQANIVEQDVCVSNDSPAEEIWNCKVILCVTGDTSVYFDVLLTVHLSIFILVINQLDAQNFCFTISLFHASTCFEHHVVIIRRSKLYYTAAGIITLKQVSGLKLLKYNSINMSK